MKFYAKRVQYVCILPFFNFIMYWFRLAGIINSIKGARTWSTRSFKEEKAVCKQLIKSDMAFVQNMIKKIKVRIYKDDAKVDDSK